MLNLVSIKSGLLVQDLFHASRICLCVLSNLDWLQLEFILRTLTSFALNNLPYGHDDFELWAFVWLWSDHRKNMTLCVMLQHRASEDISHGVTTCHFCPNRSHWATQKSTQMQREYDLCMSSRLWGMFSVCVCMRLCNNKLCIWNMNLHTPTNMCMHTDRYTWPSRNWDSWQHLQGHVCLYSLICSSVAWTLSATLFHCDGKHTTPRSIFSHSSTFVGFVFPNSSFIVRWEFPASGSTTAPVFALSAQSCCIDFTLDDGWQRVIVKQD